MGSPDQCQSVSASITIESPMPQNAWEARFLASVEAEVRRGVPRLGAFARGPVELTDCLARALRITFLGVARLDAIAAGVVGHAPQQVGPAIAFGGAGRANGQPLRAEDRAASPAEGIATCEARSLARFLNRQGRGSARAPPGPAAPRPRLLPPRRRHNRLGCPLQWTMKSSSAASAPSSATNGRLSA